MIIFEYLFLVFVGVLIGLPIGFFIFRKIQKRKDTKLIELAKHEEIISDSLDITWGIDIMLLRDIFLRAKSLGRIERFREEEIEKNAYRKGRQDEQNTVSRGANLLSIATHNQSKAFARIGEGLNKMAMGMQRTPEIEQDYIDSDAIEIDSSVAGLLESEV